jgi:hypothetical protein
VKRGKGTEMLPDTESAPEVHKTGHRPVDMIVGLSAILISLCSLGLAIHHGHTMERLVEANSRPFLQFATGNADPRAAATPNGDGEFVPVLHVSISNPGAGAARIDRVSIALDGQGVADWSELFRRLKDEAIAKHLLPPGLVSSGTFTYSSVAESYLKAGAEHPLVRWPRTDANAVLWDYIDAARQANRITLSACYCSIFEQCWIAKSESFRPVATKACS